MATYPPDRHVLRDLAVATELHALDHATGDAPVTDAVRDADGGMALGVVATLIDVTCARVAFAAAGPHWIATSDLSISTGRPLSGDVVRTEARLLRSGSKKIVIGVDLLDDTSEAPGGSAIATFMRIPRSASAVSVDPLSTVGHRTVMERTGPPPAQPIVEELGLRVVDAESGVVELDNHDYVRNSFGTINGGVMAALVAHAAEQAAPGTVAADLVLRYLGQTKAGPARTAARPVRRGIDHAVYEVRVTDAGDALLATATVTTVVRRLPG